MGHRAELLFTELHNALNQILETRPISGTPDGGKKAPESSHQIVELEEMLQKEREDFEVVYVYHTTFLHALFILFFICWRGKLHILILWYLNRDMTLFRNHYKKRCIGR